VIKDEESAMISLILASAFFVGIHVFVSGTRLRDRLVAQLGEQGFRGVFSALSLVGMVWMGWAYSRAPSIELWGKAHAFRPLALLLALLAFLFVGIGLTTPSPTAVGGEAQLDQPEPARGILRVTRHPFLWGVALWAFTHLILNGDAASFVLFGALLLLALIGPRSIDAKRQRAFGGKWGRFAAVTSNVPFAAIIEGRNVLRLDELGMWRIGVGFALYVVLLLSHRWLFGVSPFPI
jgi:uncharacterized membrane protein